ncbi:MAG: hypothetical protein GY869_30915 [Planctomycetes bacterium]|nr:hypothetical protein [Planctomycetota bacterium]
MIVTWYTFFIPANLIGIGWIAFTAKNTDVNPIIAIAACLLFIVLNVWAFQVCHVAKNYYIDTNRRIKTILEVLAPHGDDDSIKPKSPLPANHYTKAIRVMELSFYAAIAAWVILLIYWLWHGFIE